MRNEGLNTYVDLMSYVADAGKKERITENMRDNTIYHRDLLLTRIERKETAYDKLGQCVITHDIDARNDKGMIEIQEMMDQIRGEATMAQTMMKRVMQPHEDEWKLRGRGNEVMAANLDTVKTRP